MFNLTPLKVDLLLGLIVVAVILVAVYVHRSKAASKPNDIPDGFGLQETIKRVKADLMQANNDQTAPMFKVKTFDLELNVIVRESTTQKGALEFKVVSFGADQESSNEKAQKITLHMETIETKVTQTDPSEINPGPTPKPLNSPPPPKENR